MNAWSWCVSRLPFDWASYGFMQNALLAVVLITPVLALLGCMIINNQMAFYSDAIGHSALTGVAIGALAGLADPTWPMVMLGVALALGIMAVRRFSTASMDTVIGVMMAVMVALGIVILSRGGGFAKASRFLIGDILTISPGDLWRLAVLTGVVLVFWVFGFNRLFLAAVNRSLAGSRHVPVWMVDAVFSALVAVAVMLSIQWVGLLVINALLIVPAAASRNLANTTPQYYGLAVLIGLACGVLGLVASFYVGSATGATIVLVAGLFFALSLGIRVATRRTG